MGAEEKTTKEMAYEQFDRWLLEQPYWLQDATYKIYHGTVIDDSQIDKYADLCIIQAKKEKAEYKHLADKESSISAPSTQVSIVKISNINGVNALANDANLEFSKEGVTVVYGLNGAGKSGFMRIFKHLCNCPYQEPIYPNVFKPQRDESTSCVLQTVVNGADTTVTCNLSTNNTSSPLTGCDVFDTRISNAYITSSSSSSYQPFVFTVLTELANIAERIKKRIENKREGITEKSIEIPKEYMTRNDISWIRDLTSQSVIPEQYRSWTEAQEKRLSELPGLLDSDKVKQHYQLLNKNMRVISSILDDLTSARALLQSDRIALTYKNYCNAKEKLSVAEKLFSDTADEKDIISIQSENWKKLWAIAKKYYENDMPNADGKSFGEEGSICPLCHQRIAGITAERFHNVNDYINGTCSEDSLRTSRDFLEQIKKITYRSYSQEQITQLLDGVLDDESILVVKNAYEQFSIDCLNNDLETVYSLVSDINIDEAYGYIKDKYKELNDKISILKEALDDKQREALQIELSELKYHKWAHDTISRIETVINNLKKEEVLLTARQLLTTNKITIESNRLAEALITEAYISRFNEEMHHLAPEVKVKLQRVASQKGVTPYKVVLDTNTGAKCKADEVLSEGEQRIVSLAAFFADATGRNDKTPIIIDDPISSLDYYYEEKTIKRIVQLAQTRQIIVFTHRISFLVGITDECALRNIPCKENWIKRGDKGNGIKDFVSCYHGKVLPQLNGMLNTIAQVKKQDHDSELFMFTVSNICQQFRICVERSVENELLYGIVRRFNRKIRTDGLVKKLSAITNDDCKIIDEMMTKYSYNEHSQPDEAPSIPFDIEIIEEDVKNFRNWLNDYTKRA